MSLTHNSCEHSSRIEQAISSDGKKGPEETVSEGIDQSAQTVCEKSELVQIREEIDDIDAQLIALLEKRFALVSELLPYKKQLSDLRREEKILSKSDSIYIKTLYKEIFRLSKELLREQGFSS